MVRAVRRTRLAGDQMVFADAGGIAKRSARQGAEVGNGVAAEVPFMPAQQKTMAHTGNQVPPQDVASQSNRCGSGVGGAGKIHGSELAAGEQKRVVHSGGVPIPARTIAARG